MSSTVTVSAPQITTDRGRERLSACVEIEGRACEIYFQSSAGHLSASADPFLAAALLPAMSRGAPIRLAGPVSSRLVENVSVIQDIITTWYKTFRPVPVAAASLATYPPQAERGAACTFSGDVDSFYSVLQHQTELAALVAVHGFAIPVTDRAAWSAAMQMLHAAAGELHKPIIEVETNVCALLDPYTSWEEQSSGAAVASVALALAPQFSLMYVAAPLPYTHLAPRGTHPLLDPLWSNDVVEIVHDGAETSRWQKLEAICTHETARRWLCSHAGNSCGHCPDCLCLMAYLNVLGIQEQFAAVNVPLNLDELAHMDIADYTTRANAELLYDAIVQKGTARAIAQALRAGLKLPAAYDENKKNEQELRLATARITQLRARVHHVDSSRSWRLTAPLRTVAATARRLSGKRAT